ncbi:uncharacterized protein LOC132800760 [Ziziphus jujuba]|uniref:Uncharacterized protein LOC132800760 n=1 Tax=Ziziphus jujuba TaxID=326968 RepID=A0ABM4A2P1_ZIZJJ|nr:uncharacterized protein LOC132800760 [Ziziphus jujuba]
MYLFACPGPFIVSTVLNLKSVDVSGEVIERFLSNCHVLERLSVYDFETLIRLKVVGQSLTLKFFFFLLDYVITLLSIIDRHHNHVINQVSCCLSQLEILRVGNISEVSKIGEVIPNPILTNMKHLHLLVDISVHVFRQLNSIMKAFPCLQRLLLALSYLLPLQRCKECYGEYTKADNCCYNNNLKVVEIFGYYGHEKVDEFVMNVIENVVTVEKIIIDPRDWFSFPLVVSDDVEDIWEHARIHAMKELKSKVPSTIEFVCS